MYFGSHGKMANFIKEKERTWVILYKTVNYFQINFNLWKVVVAMGTKTVAAWSTVLSS